MLATFRRVLLFTELVILKNSPHRLKKLLTGVILLIFSLTPFSLSALATVELRDGSLVRGEVISEKADKLYLDLGYTLLEIPREEILAVIDEDAMQDETAAREDLYYVANEPRTRTVKDLVSELGEAVVVVRTPSGLGSGFVINPEGYVITNNHVVAGEHDLTVTVYTRQAGDMLKEDFQNVRIVALSDAHDLALLKIEGVGERELVYVPLADSGQLRQGEPVFAIGSPLGLERSVSQGIVSVPNRLIEGDLYIQDTAEISPGNSGGPLFNLKGEVVGVNNMKVVGMGAEGLGFAIPSSTLKLFLMNRDAFAFDPSNPNAGFRYIAPPVISEQNNEPTK